MATSEHRFRENIILRGTFWPLMDGQLIGVWSCGLVQGRVAQRAESWRVWQRLIAPVVVGVRFDREVSADYVSYSRGVKLIRNIEWASIHWNSCRARPAFFVDAPGQSPRMACGLNVASLMAGRETTV